MSAEERARRVSACNAWRAERGQQRANPWDLMAEEQKAAARAKVSAAKVAYWAKWRAERGR